MTHEELKDRVSVEEFYEWMALEQIEPFGEQGHYLRMGILAAVVANGFRSMAGAKGTPLKPSDFIPKVEAKKTQSSSPEAPAQLYAFMMGLVKDA